MFEPVQKCENNAISKQNYTLKLFIAVKMTYCCCSSLGGHLDFLYFHLKKFYNIDYWTIAFGKMFLTWAIPGLFFDLFLVCFKQTLQILHQINGNKFPSSSAWWIKACDQ